MTVMKKIVLFSVAANQRREDEISLVKNYRSRRLTNDVCDRTASHVILGAKIFYFQGVGKVCGRRFSRQFYCRTRKQSHNTNTQRDVKRLQTLLGTRNELKKVEEIPAVELNEYI